jgi:hypothetical protein
MAWSHMWPCLRTKKYGILTCSMTKFAKEKYSERRVSRLCRLEHWEAGSVLSCMCGSKHWEVGSVVAFVWATKTRRRVLLEEPDIWIAQHSSVTVGGGKSGRDEFGAKDETSALGTQRRTYTQFFWLWIYEAMNDAWRTCTQIFFSCHYTKQRRTQMNVGTHVSD